PLRGVSPESVKAIALCSVVPPLTPSFVQLCKDYFDTEPLEVGAGTKTGIRVKYDTPRDVGADRIVDAAAALAIYGGPAIVVDLGTATVFDAVTNTGDYLGGAIAPGIQIAADSLYHTTAQLRRVELTAPPFAIGKNTVHSLQSGLVLGYAELVKGMVRRFDEELGGNSKVVATGGLASVVASDVGLFDAIDPDLTLTGLRLIHEMNSG
ncbi:MAG: type III pantothenate kinase, partial [SAR202 cluster bacterium]|nr:type III pantothenate kinase [SAR202 cluster bacterium]